MPEHAAGKKPGPDSAATTAKPRAPSGPATPVNPAWQRLAFQTSPVAERGLRSPGRPLDGETRDAAESKFGHDFSRVRVHDDEVAARSAAVMGAGAYTVGSDIVFGRNRHNTSAQSRRLLGHELTHVVQQGSGAASVTAGAQPSESEAHAASQAHQHADVQIATRPGVAFSIEDWLTSSPDISNMSYSTLTDEIDEIEQWRARQTTSSAESARLEEVLAELQAEATRKEKAASRPARRRPRRKGRASKAAAPTGPEMQKPRILAEATSVAYEDPNEMRAEVDRIVAWLARDDVSKADRQILLLELANLAPQFQQRRAQRVAERHSAAIQSALAPSADLLDAKAQTLEVMRRIDGIYKRPDGPGYILMRGTEMLLMEEEAYNTLRASASKALKGAAARARGMNHATGFRADEHMKLNYDDQYVVGFLVSVWSGEEPVDMVNEVRELIRNANRTINQYEGLGGSASLEKQAEIVLLAVQRADAARLRLDKGIDRAMSAAGDIVTGLTIVRDLAFTVALSLGAVVVAPLVAAGAAGAGLTGIGAAGATMVGTGTVIGTGGAVLGGGSAALGEIAAGHTWEDATNAAVREGSKWAKQGAAIGLAGGTTQVAGAALRVGAPGLSTFSNVARGTGAQVAGNVVGSGAGTAFEGGSITDVAKSAGFGGATGLLGGPLGYGVNKIASPGLRTMANIGVGGGSGFGSTYALTGDTNQAWQSAAIGATVSGVQSRQTTTDPTKGQQTAFKAGQTARSTVQGWTRDARSMLAATMIGTSNPVTQVRAGSPPIVQTVQGSAIAAPSQQPLSHTDPPVAPQPPTAASTVQTNAAQSAQTPAASIPAPGRPAARFLPASVADDFIARLEGADHPFSLDVGARRAAQIQSGQKDFVLDRPITFDVDEPLAVGAPGIKPQRAVRRALDPHNRQLLDPHTNRISKHVGTSPEDVVRGGRSLTPVSVADDPGAIFTRRFDEVTELRQVFDQAVARIPDPGTYRPTALKNQINANIRDIIQNGRSPAGIAVRDALNAQGFAFVPGLGLAAVPSP